jgi:hypothetical protein
VLALALAPALVAVWLVPGFVTQDGPAHVYNAHILVQSLGTHSPFVGTYAVNWEPLPNWAGHAVLMGLVSVLEAPAAERAMTSLTLVSVAASMLWLRRRVRGDSGLAGAALWAALLAMNLTWLLGFYSFLLGVCLFAITLSTWWDCRGSLGPASTLKQAGLLVVGYFCHPISLAATVLGLLVLAFAEPTPGRSRRWAWTLAGLTPLVPLGIAYRGLMRAGGELAPFWGTLRRDPYVLKTWWEHLGWVDPLTLGRTVSMPFVERVSPWFRAAAPIFWFGAAATALTIATSRAGQRPSPVRGWVALALVLVLGGIVAPDTLGPTHGNYLAQRILLLGLVAALPVLDLAGRSRWARAGRVCLVLAVVLQVAFVLDYAWRSKRVVRPFLDAKQAVGHGHRVGTLLVDVRGRYRANPLLHLDSFFGVGAGNIVWENYESAFYYFPVRIRPDVVHPPVPEFEAIALLDPVRQGDEKRRLWKALVERFRDQMDVIVVWGDAPGLAAIHGPYYQTVYHVDGVRVLRRRGRP